MRRLLMRRGTLIPLIGDEPVVVEPQPDVPFRNERLIVPPSLVDRARSFTPTSREED